MEHSPLPPNTAGLTMYVKASEPVELKVRGAVFAADTQWRKIDLTWQKLGTTPEKPNIGFQFEMGLSAPAAHEVWYIVDRLGVEGPAFDDNPTIKPTAGLDETINTFDIIGNAQVLAPTVQRLKNKQPFKILAFGDSVTAGAQANRGNWGVTDADIPRFLYFGHLARLLEAQYGYQGITPVQKGYGEWTSEQALKVMKDVFAQAGPEDVIIIEFGANDLGWANKTVDIWLANMKQIVAEARKKTTQIIVMSPTTGGKVPQLADEVSRKFRAFAKEENVAWADISRWSLYRGEAFAWAYLANEYHPDFMGHVMIAEILHPLFGAPNFDWPPYAGKKQQAG